MSADLRLHVRAHAVLVAYFNGKGNPVPRKFSLIVSIGRRDREGPVQRALAAVCCHFLFPGAGLPFDQVYSHFDFLGLSGIDYPDDLAAGFLSPSWTADYVSRLQVSFQAGDLGAMMADVAGLGIVEEWTTVCAHAKHSDRQLYIQPGLWFF